MISFSSVENCDILSFMLERMFPYKYCTDEAFPWCVLNCVELSYLMLSGSNALESLSTEILEPNSLDTDIKSIM